MAAGLWRRVRANGALFWRWFLYWRRRYMWLRLAIIVIIFAEPVYGVFHPLTRDLVVIAIKGIESAKVGPGRYAQYYQFVEKKQLQKKLLARFDVNHDGRLEPAEAARLRKETGLTASQVTGKGIRVQLDPLIEANHKLKLVPPEVTGKVLRREALDRALADIEQEHQQLWREMKPDLDMKYPGWRDYLKLGTWKRGTDTFRGVIGYGVAFPVAQYFIGLWPSGEQYGMMARPSVWHGLLGWVGLIVAIAIAVRRYTKGEELRKRFEADPEFALAPCPICGTPTHDYGALRQQRWARAWTAAVVVGLAAGTLALIAAERQVLEQRYTESVDTVFTAIPLIVAITLASGILRWLLWPREIHAAHTRPWMRAVGLGASVVLVVWLVSAMALLTVRAYS